jgi:hypothetical protein
MLPLHYCADCGAPIYSGEPYSEYADGPVCQECDSCVVECGREAWPREREPEFVDDDGFVV